MNALTFIAAISIATAIVWGDRIKTWTDSHISRPVSKELLVNEGTIVWNCKPVKYEQSLTITKK
jgi:hypothetical protein